MNKLRTFFRTAVLSFTSPSYYADIANARLSFSFKYYFCFMFLFSITASTIITVRWIIPFSRFAAQDLPPLLANVYPKELIVTINNGQVSTNVNEPYFIPLSRLEPISEAFKQKVLGSNESELQNLLVIDTEGHPEDITSYSTWALLTWDSLSYINDNKHIETVPLKDVENITINRESVVKLIDSLTPIINYVAPILAGIVFLAYALYGFLRLLYILFLAFLLWMVSLVIKTSLPFEKVFQLVLHTNFIPFTIFSLLGLFGLIIPVPFFETVSQLIIGLVVLQTIKSRVKNQIPTPSVPPNTRSPL